MDGGPRLTDLKLVAFPPDLVGVLRLVGLRGFRRLAALSEAKYVGDDVARAGGDTPRLHPQRDLHMRLALGVRVVLGVLAQSLYCV